MKRDFLQNFKVGDQALPKEIIDAIMAENGRDIEEAKKPFLIGDGSARSVAEVVTGFALHRDICFRKNHINPNLLR